MKRWLPITGAILAVGVAIFLAAEKRIVAREDCSSRMYGTLFAAKLWSEDNGGRLPSDFISMSNELNNPKILICPSDHSRQMAATWASFTTNNSSYEMVAPGIYQTNTNVVNLRCKIHGYVGYSDGGVLDESGGVVVRSRF